MAIKIDKENAFHQAHSINMLKLELHSKNNIILEIFRTINTSKNMTYYYYYYYYYIRLKAFFPGQLG